MSTYKDSQWYKDQQRPKAGFGHKEDLTQLITEGVKDREKQASFEAAREAREFLGLEDEAETDYNGTLDIQTDVSTLKAMLEVDFESFVYLFLYEEEGIEQGVPHFHIYGLKQMTAADIFQLAIAWPRDHAKTTLAKIACVWLMAYTPYRFLAYVCHTNTLAANACKDIADMIRRPLIQQIYGSAIFGQAGEAKGEYTFSWCDKTIIIRALGVGQSVRGLNINNKRPDILILDDIESAEEGEDNKMGYSGITTWYYGTLRKALDRRRNKTIQIGNYVSNKSLLGDNLNSKYWVSTKLSAITKTGKPLWPARWSLAQLRLDLLEYIENRKMHTWLCEMMNMPLSEASAILKSSDVSFVEELTPEDEDIMLRCITVDPAITANMKYADSAVIAVHVYKGSLWQLAEIRSFKGKGPFETYNEIIELAAKWRVLTVGIETEGYQEALRQVCEVEAGRAGLRRMQFLPLKTGKKAKSSRIVAFANMIKMGLYGFSMKDFGVIEDLIKFDIHSKTNVDDRPDCCAYILQMVEKYTMEMAQLVDIEMKQKMVSASQDHANAIHLRN